MASCKARCNTYVCRQIAGSIGPYGAALSDGSEYSGNYVDEMTVDDLINWHRPRMKVGSSYFCCLLKRYSVTFYSNSSQQHILQQQEKF